MTTIRKSGGEEERLRAEITRLKELADTDPLLPVFNRRAFLRELARFQALRDRQGLSAVLICLDLDLFKTVRRSTTVMAMRQGTPC